MRIELADLESGKGAFAHDYAPDELVLQDSRLRLAMPPTVAGKVRLEGRRAHIKGKVNAAVQLECDRCLKPIEVSVASAFKVEYVTPEDYQEQQAIELTEEDLDLSIFDGETIDVDKLVTEELLLAVPDHVLCSENCKGICATCGVDRNATECGCDSQQVDPRWAGLKELVNRE
ncbi:MAG TPA: DUF177 domain-containing protein [Pyrinomonadaceae bacterium]|jgi:uncharacterized protein|nr:DUF177 domain-containing protein [Pyrinomonadaceae bacterium]